MYSYKKTILFFLCVLSLTSCGLLIDGVVFAETSKEYNKHNFNLEKNALFNPEYYYFQNEFLEDFQYEKYNGNIVIYNPKSVRISGVSDYTQGFTFKQKINSSIEYENLKNVYTKLTSLSKLVAYDLSSIEFYKNLHPLLSEKGRKEFSYSNLYNNTQSGMFARLKAQEKLKVLGLDKLLINMSKEINQSDYVVFEPEEGKYMPKYNFQRQNFSFKSSVRKINCTLTTDTIKPDEAEKISSPDFYWKLYYYQGKKPVKIEVYILNKTIATFTKNNTSCLY